MKLKIYQAGEPVLRRRAKALTVDEIRGDEVQRLIDLMRETMRDAPGVGLAAPQMGVSLQLAVIEDQPSYIERMAAGQAQARERVPVPFHVLINPRLTLLEGEPVEFFEGCLSLSGYTAIVPRARNVRVDALNEKGEPITIEAAGWYARILQHEIDHLQGVMYIDRMRSQTFMSMENNGRYWKDMEAAEVIKELDARRD